MRVLVTGATGLIGHELSIRLLEAGHELVVLSRNAGKARESMSLPAEYFSWDTLKGPPPAESLRDLDSVVHLAGESVMNARWNPERKRAIRDSRVVGTQNLVRGLREIQGKKPQVLVAGSAIGYYGNRGDEILDERRGAGSGFLAEICKDWEREAERASEAGMRVVHLRTGIVLSTQGGALRRLVEVFQAGVGSPVGSGKQWMSWIHIEDLVVMIIAALEKPAIRGAINGAAPEPVTNYELSRQLAAILHRPLLPRVPGPALRIVLGEMAVEALSSARVIPAAALYAGFQFKYPRLDGALKALLIGDEGQVADELVKVQWVAKPLDEVFAFFGNEKNLEALTPAWLNFKILGKSTARLEAGSLIDYRLKIHGVPLRWQSRIDNWEPPRFFSDTQTRGPYSFWNHAHTFSALKGGTLIRDRVRYGVPGGFLGKALGSRWVRKDLEKIFGFRRKAVSEVFGRG